MLTLGRASAYGRFLVRRLLEADDLVYRAMVAGSVRRQVARPRDVDIVVSSHVWDDHDSPQRIIERLKLTPREVTPNCGVFDIAGIRVTLTSVPIRGYGIGVLCMTGPRRYSKEVLAAGRALGYKLNHTMIYDGDDNPVPVGNEQDALDLLGLPYIDPKERV